MCLVIDAVHVVVVLLQIICVHLAVALPHPPPLLLPPHLVAAVIVTPIIIPLLVQPQQLPPSTTIMSATPIRVALHNNFA